MYVTYFGLAFFLSPLEMLKALAEEADSSSSSLLEALECIAAKYRGPLGAWRQAATASGSTEAASAAAAEGASFTLLDSLPQSPNSPEIHDSDRTPAEQVRNLARGLACLPCAQHSIAQYSLPRARQG